MTNKDIHVVIIGAGFGGLAVAKNLAQKENIRVTLIDRRNHHLFQPLLYQVATTTLAAPDIARSVRSIFKDGDHVRPLYETAVGFDLEHNILKLDSGNELSYDYLVMATGAKTSFFGNDHWAEHVLELKSLSDALQVRKNVLQRMELAERDNGSQESSSVVIVGGGPTGVELAGAFSDLIKRSMKRKFKKFDPEKQKIILLEGQKHILGVFQENQSIYAEKHLKKLGVDVRTSTMVENIEKNKITLKGGEVIEAGTIIWTAGVQATELTRSLGVELTRGGLVKVTPELNLPGHENVFVIGDTAAVQQKDGSFVPGVAPAAVQGGEYVAQAILKREAKESITPFKYKDKGKMAIIGKGSAIVDINGTQLNGFIGWFTWLFVHVLFLVDFRSKYSVVVSWFLSYVTNIPGSRVFTTPAESKEIDS